MPCSLVREGTPCCFSPPDPPIASWSRAADPPAWCRAATTRASALGASLLALGAARLAAGQVDDLAGLVPEYVTLPRGVTTQSGEVSWSRDPR